MTDVSDIQQKQKRFRSPPYPMFDLEQAVDRAKKIHDKAQQHFVGSEVLKDAWGLKTVEGKLWRAAAALIQYGLLFDIGSKKQRKFQITDIAKRIIIDRDQQSEKRLDALKVAALMPMINKELWEKYKTAKNLSDKVVETYLILDRGDAGEATYSGAAAEEVISRYRASLAFAGLTEDTLLVDNKKEQGDINDSFHKYAVGDLVKWTSGGVDQFDAKKVEWISPDHSHIRIEGSKTGIPINEIEIITPSLTKDSRNQMEEFDLDEQESKISDVKTKKIKASVENGRLIIAANVSADEITALQEMLSKYKEILEMLE